MPDSKNVERFWFSFETSINVEVLQVSGSVSQCRENENLPPRQNADSKATGHTPVVEFLDVYVNSKAQICPSWGPWKIDFWFLNLKACWGPTMAYCIRKITAIFFFKRKVLDDTESKIIVLISHKKLTLD